MLMWFFNAMSVLVCFIFVFYLGVAVGYWAKKHAIAKRLKAQGVDPKFIEIIEAMD